jgi:predicted ATPase
VRLQELERLMLRQDPSLDAPAAASRQTARLPVAPTTMLGRRLEVAAVAALLRRDEVRLLTLTGPGGTGKTRLALATAEELAHEFRDDVAFVDLSAIRSGGFVLPTIAEALGLPAADQPLVPAIAGHIRDRRPLLVLDNLEQLRDEVAGIGELLAATARLTLLATSRAPLRLAAEHLYPVPPLPAPDAVDLFAVRARAVDPGWELNEANEPHVADICRRLDGLPLAIELAAARIGLLSVEEIAVRLEGALDLLVDGARDAPGRQQTLRATLDWSWELLDERERTALAQLSVFAGAVDLSAIEAVCSGRDVLSSAASLVE